MPKGKLDDQAQRYVIKSLGEFKPNSFIIKGLAEKYGIVYFSEPGITHYRKKFKDAIDRHRVEYLRDLASIEMTHRKQRLLKLSEWLVHCEKGIPVYIRGPKGLKIAMRPDYGLGLRILEAIREEVKDARFEAGDQADGEEVMEWRLRIEKRYKDMQEQARQFDRKKAKPHGEISAEGGSASGGEEAEVVGEGEVVEDGSDEGLEAHHEPNGGRIDQSTGSTDPGTPAPPPEGEDG